MLPSGPRGVHGPFSGATMAEVSLSSCLLFALVCLPAWLAVLPGEAGTGPASCFSFLSS